MKSDLGSGEERRRRGRRAVNESWATRGVHAVHGRSICCCGGGGRRRQCWNFPVRIAAVSVCCNRGTTMFHQRPALHEASAAHQALITATTDLHPQHVALALAADLLDRPCTSADSVPSCPPLLLHTQSSIFAYSATSSRGFTASPIGCHDLDSLSYNHASQRVCSLRNRARRFWLCLQTWNNISP